MKYAFVDRNKLTLRDHKRDLWFSNLRTDITWIQTDPLFIITT